MNMTEYPGYSVVRPIAEGGMAVLYVAMDAQRRRVVIRSLKPEFQHDRRILRSFRHGARVLARLRHENIVRLIETSSLWEPAPFMVLEYVEGTNLRELILHRDPLLSRNPLSLIRQMASALYYIHASHLLHMDFKPENLLVCEDGRVVLVDFDLAISTRGWPAYVRRMPGTPSYIAPEALSRHRVDERADIFSFGITCFEMVLYHKPHEQTAAGRPVRTAQGNPFPRDWSEEALRPPVPLRLQEIIRKCLAHDKEARYPSMSLVIKDLEAIV